MISDPRRAERFGKRPAPNLPDYPKARAGFSWHSVRSDLDGLPGGRGLNIAHEAVDRHAVGSGAHRIAIRWLGKGGATRDVSYGQLRELTDRFALALRRLGVGMGDRVFVLSDRIPELYVAALGTLKNRSILCPLFSAYGPDPIRERLTLGRARVLVTTQRLYRRKVKAIRDRLPQLEHVITVGEPDRIGEPAREGDGGETLDFEEALRAPADGFAIEPTDPEDPALLHFTSGTTGAPKGVLHVHEAVLAHYATGKLVLDLRPDDVFWCTADPGWVTGVSYGIISPLTVGCTLIVDQEEFNAERWYGILQDQHVTVWYTAPTAIRMLMRAGEDVAERFDLTGLRFLASVGEPLEASAVRWGERVLGGPFHDTWWQTETGSIMIANFASAGVKPGSMGLPVPGVHATVLTRTEVGMEELRGAGVTGELALRIGWPSMFRAYIDEPERYAERFSGPWYLTGDLARIDEDGYFWFVGRLHDVIKSAGHLIGPIEVEDCLRDHPAVAEVGVIGRPDVVAGQIVKACVVLRPGYEENDALARELLAHARRRLGPVVGPKEIRFWKALPKTPSGKIMRHVLRAAETGSPPGARPSGNDSTHG
jgi:acetyl-CoA synthetase